VRGFSQASAAFLRLLVVVGPVLLGLLTALYIARPSPFFLAPGVLLAIAVVACDCWIIARHHWITGILALATHVAFLLFIGTYTASPLPPPPPLSDALPSASPPAGMAIYALPTGVNHRTAAFARRGGPLWEKWDSVMTAALIRHPQGDVMIETGLGRTIASQFKQMPFLFRLATDLVPSQPAADQLDAAGYDRKHLRYILVTHVHWDHVSGVPDFPGVPVLVTAAEHQFINDDGFANTAARNIDQLRWREYAFDGGPYLGFDRSHDLYGDGSIVIVPAPGHTPGSVVVFVALPSGSRYAFVGDLVWQREGVFEREERPWLVRGALEHDAVALRQSLLLMSAVATRFPQIILVPSHDARGYAAMPQWTRSALSNTAR